MRHQSLDEISRHNSPAPTPSATMCPNPHCHNGRVGALTCAVCKGEVMRETSHTPTRHITLDALDEPYMGPVGKHGPYGTHTNLDGSPVPPASAPNNTPMKTSLNDYARECHTANEKWWININDGTPLDRNKGELICLMHSELSEAMEGERKNLMDDKLPHRKMAEVELVDCLIRIFDYAGAFGYDLEGAYTEKMAYNAQREDHKHEARLLADGKKW